MTGNGIWYTNEFFETGEIPRKGSAEPMADKQTRNSHVRVIENSAARVVVHWRYAPIYTDYGFAHVNPETGWGDWVDEYYTLYPDGVGVRKICVHSMAPFIVSGKQPGMGGFREYQESIVINPPGTAPQDNIQIRALTLADMDGNAVTYSWEDGPPKIMLHGMTDGSAKDLVPLAKSWIRPAEMKVLQGAASSGHDPAERAYMLTVNKPGTEDTLRLRLECSGEHPAVNPAFVVAGWGKRPIAVTINGRAMEEGKDFRAGFRKTTAGTDLVLWLDRRSTKPLEIVVRPG